MRVFTVYSPPPGLETELKLLPEGFAGWGLLLGPAWLLLRGAWPFGSVAILALAVLPWSAWLGAALLSGVFGHDMRRQVLRWRGWRFDGVVAGGNHGLAELRWLDQRSTAARLAHPC